ncbi:MAG: hypothetical protein U0324_29580 [Polyangiales bacterium]
MKPLMLALVVAFTLACGADVGRATQAVGSPPPTFAQRLWTRAIRRVVVEVDYGPNAAPYTGAVPAIGDVWAVFRANATRIFRGAGKELVIPNSLAQMQRIDVSSREFTVADLLALSRRTLSTPAAADTAVLHVLVLDGWFRDETGPRTALLGGHLDGTGVIAIFRPVVASTAASGVAYIPAVVEQTTLVHEFGHAVGMVGNGVAAVSATADLAHRYHCTSAHCVMNAWYEGPAAAMAFIERYAMTRDPILFGAECLADADAAARAASL